MSFARSCRAAKVRPASSSAWLLAEDFIWIVSRARGKGEINANRYPTVKPEIEVEQGFPRVEDVRGVRIGFSLISVIL